jgi:hypothetical protein
MLGVKKRPDPAAPDAAVPAPATADRPSNNATNARQTPQQEPNADGAQKKPGSKRPANQIIKDIFGR